MAEAGEARRIIRIVILMGRPVLLLLAVVRQIHNSHILINAEFVCQIQAWHVSELFHGFRIGMDALIQLLIVRKVYPDIVQVRMNVNQMEDMTLHIHPVPRALTIIAMIKLWGNIIISVGYGILLEIDNIF